MNTSLPIPSQSPHPYSTYGKISKESIQGFMENLLELRSKIYQQDIKKVDQFTAFASDY